MKRLVFMLMVLACSTGVALAGAKAAKPKAKAKPNAKATAKPKAKPSGVLYLPNTKLRYYLHVPKGYDAKKKYPLVLVAPYRDDRTVQSYKVWEGMAKEDGFFLAALEFPRGSKENREKRLTELAETLCKKYAGIDREHLVIVGLEGGAAQIITYMATYPRVFAAGLAMDLRSLSDVSKVKPNAKPALVRSGVLLYITFHPKYFKSGKALSAARSRLRRLGISVRVKLTEPAGQGKPSELEAKLAHDVIRSHYSSELREQVTARLHAAAEAARKKAEAEKRKAAAAKAAQAAKVAVAKENPDDLLLGAQTAFEGQDYAKSLELYQKLLKVRPTGEYARVAKQRIKELTTDPSLQRGIADGRAEDKVRPLLSMARNYRRAKDFERAARYYRKIIKEYPGTTFAEEAKNEFDAMIAP